MTVIAAHAHEGAAYMAADSRVSSDHIRDHFRKIEVLPNGAVVGIAGTPLWHGFVVGYTPELVDLASVRDFAWAWVAWAKRIDTALDDGNPIGSMLVITPSAMLVQVCSDGSALVIPPGHYVAIGSGGTFALGAMHAGGGVVDAVRAGIALDAHCGGAVYFEGVVTSAGPPASG